MKEKEKRTSSGFMTRTHATREQWDTLAAFHASCEAFVRALAAKAGHDPGMLKHAEVFAALAASARQAAGGRSE